jgi:hypothetical protein
MRRENIRNTRWFTRVLFTVTSVAALTVIASGVTAWTTAAAASTSGTGVLTGTFTTNSNGVCLDYAQGASTLAGTLDTGSVGTIDLGAWSSSTCTTNGSFTTTYVVQPVGSQSVSGSCTGVSDVNPNVNQMTVELTCSAPASGPYDSFLLDEAVDMPFIFVASEIQSVTPISLPGFPLPNLPTNDLGTYTMT